MQLDNGLLIVCTVVLLVMAVVGTGHIKSLNSDIEHYKEQINKLVEEDKSFIVVQYTLRKPEEETSVYLRDGTLVKAKEEKIKIKPYQTIEFMARPDNKLLGFLIAREN